MPEYACMIYMHTWAHRHANTDMSIYAEVKIPTV